MEIFDSAGKYETELIDFLSHVEGMSITQELLDNASIIYDEKIIGTISYEVFGNMGLIRYFVFRKEAHIDYIIKLIETVHLKAKQKGIEILFSMANDDEVSLFFKNLGFMEYNRKRVYLEEEKLDNTKYKDVKIMVFKNVVMN